jgi:hypothetical protein
MGKYCGICKHPSRKIIERLILKRVGYRIIARDYGVDKGCCVNHRRECMKRRILKAADKLDIVLGADLLDKLERLEKRFEQLATQAQQLCQIPAAVLALKELRATLELIHKMTAEMHPVKRNISLEQANDTEAHQYLINKLLRYPQVRREQEAKVIDAEFVDEDETKAG